MHESTDSPDLLRQASQGDETALAALLQRHLPGLRAYVRLRTGKILRAKESVSDLVQSVCREVIQHADRFQHGGEVGFRRWLYKTALRKIANRQEYYEAGKRNVGREANASPRLGGSEADLLDCYATLHTPSREVAASEGVARIEAAFDRLPDQYRDVIVLAKIVGLSRAEIAAEMGRTEAAIGNLLYRALTELSGILDQGEGSNS